MNIEKKSSAAEWMPALDPSQIAVVLVNTSHPGHIGATARAMKNMGLTQLILVDPEDFPSGAATARAVSAVDILENARVVSTLEEAVAEIQLEVALMRGGYRMFLKVCAALGIIAGLFIAWKASGGTGEKWTL